MIFADGVSVSSTMLCTASTSHQTLSHSDTVKRCFISSVSYVKNGVLMITFFNTVLAAGNVLYNSLLTVQDTVTLRFVLNHNLETFSTDESFAFAFSQVK